MRKQSGRERLAMGTGINNFGARIRRTPIAGVGSPLLRQLAAQVWDEVTGGTGVMLDEHGKPVEASPVKRSKGAR